MDGNTKLHRIEESQPEWNLLRHAVTINSCTTFIPDMLRHLLISPAPVKPDYLKNISRFLHCRYLPMTEPGTHAFFARYASSSENARKQFLPGEIPDAESPCCLVRDSVRYQKRTRGYSLGNQLQIYPMQAHNTQADKGGSESARETGRETGHPVRCDCGGRQ